MFSVTCFLSLSLLFVFSFERSIRFHLFTAEAARRWWPRNVEAESWPMRRQGTGQSGRSVKIFMRWYILWTYYSCIYSTHDDYLLTSCWSLKQTFNCIFLVPKGPAPSRDIQDIKTVTHIVALQVHEILGISSDAKKMCDLDIHQDMSVIGSSWHFNQGMCWRHYPWKRRKTFDAWERRLVISLVLRRLRGFIAFHFFAHNTVDGRNPAPVDMYFIPLFLRFYTLQVVQESFHQAYGPYGSIFRPSKPTPGVRRAEGRCSALTAVHLESMLRELLWAPKEAAISTPKKTS